jgi:hypothetical protein
MVCYVYRCVQLLEASAASKLARLVIASTHRTVINSKKYGPDSRQLLHICRAVIGNMCATRSCCDCIQPSYRSSGCSTVVSENLSGHSTVFMPG